MFVLSSWFGLCCWWMLSFYRFIIWTADMSRSLHLLLVRSFTHWTDAQWLGVIQSRTQRFYNKLLQNIEQYSYGNCLFCWCLCWCNLITDSVDSIKDNFNSQRKMLQTITILFVYAFDSFSFHCRLNVVSFFPRFYSHHFIIIAKCVCTFS